MEVLAGKRRVHVRVSTFGKADTAVLIFAASTSRTARSQCSKPPESKWWQAWKCIATRVTEPRAAEPRVSAAGPRELVEAELICFIEGGKKLVGLLGVRCEARGGKKKESITYLQKLSACCHR